MSPESPDSSGPLARAHQILGIPVRDETPAQVVAKIERWCTSRDSRVVVCAAVLTANLARWSRRFRLAVGSADHVTPDGMPLVWVLRRSGATHAVRVYGPGLTLDLCAMAARANLRVGLLGGRDDVREQMEAALLRKWPDLAIAFSESPPFRRPTAREENALCRRVTDARVHILLVGLGCPKQELWMARNRDRLECVSVGVGAAFDFIAGEVPQAPAWMQGAGLEWLFRLGSEPRRLWRRYLLGNPAFVFASLARMFRTR